MGLKDDSAAWDYVRFELEPPFLDRVEFALMLLAGIGVIISSSLTPDELSQTLALTTGIATSAFGAFGLITINFDRLVATTSGLRYTNIGLFRWCARWSDCSEFTVFEFKQLRILRWISPMETSMVVFDDFRVLKRRNGRGRDPLSGKTSMLPSNYGMTASDLVEMLNKCRLDALRTDMYAATAEEVFGASSAKTAF